MKIIDADGQDVTPGAIEACPAGRILQSRLPNVATAITLVNNTAYFVYLGCTTRAMAVKLVEFYVNTAGAGSPTAEAGLFTTAFPPNKNNQTIYKLTTTGTLDGLTTVGLKRNTNAFNSGNGYVVATGTPLWAGIRTAMGTTQPSLAGLCMDYSQGLVLYNTNAGALTGGGPWEGYLIPVAAYHYTPVAPDLRLTLD